VQGDQGRIISVSRKLGREVLNDGAINKGTAFPHAERERMHIRGLLPPAVSSLEMQVRGTPPTGPSSRRTGHRAQAWSSSTL
jgi:hypothetical protein